MANSYKPIVLVVLDGWGEWDVVIGNPLMAARLPVIGGLDKYYPKLLLEASGLSVGLPWGVMGNSEVGHQTMGVGQIVFEASPAIDMSIRSGAFFKNEARLKMFAELKGSRSDLHIWGLLSDGGVHSRLEHLFALAKFARDQGVPNFYIHAVTDGRDTPRTSGRDYVAKLKKALAALGSGRLATICGRYFAMDRNQNWDRIEKAFALMAMCDGQAETDPIAAIDRQYARGVYDEYLEPVVLTDESGGPVVRVKDGDGMICFNFRGDRARQMTRAFTEPDFDHFRAVVRPRDIRYACFTEYEKGLKAEVIFPPHTISARLGACLAEAGKKQLRIAETEKYAHVTYFFNGGLEEPFLGEERVLVPSKNAPSYADVPEMSAAEINGRLIPLVEAKKHDFILINYANPDMVGHTGVFAAGVKAVECVDQCLGKLMAAVLAAGGAMIITADHGNVEEMLNVETGEIDTKHSTNPVPCWLVTPDGRRPAPLPAAKMPKEMEGMLVDIAPSILDLFGLKPPAGMTGRSLVPLLRLRGQK